MKLGMLAVAKQLQSKQLKTKIILQVHDELVLEGPQEEAHDVYKILKNAMEQAVQFKVPMVVDVGNGHNWLEAK
jgi:DNA polymerase-1